MDLQSQMPGQGHKIDLVRTWKYDSLVYTYA